MKNRILFVDDEPNLLTGLRRMLRGQKSEWDMDFAQGGREALGKMAELPFDVVVSDMLMPEMNGAALLREVRNCYPQTTRIVLSGQADRSGFEQSLAEAHQFLSKPCPAEALIDTVKRACALRETIKDPEIARVVSRITSLPCHPGICDELSTELNLEEPSIQRVGELIAQDVGLTAKLLQAVNASTFGAEQHVEDPVHAARLLGLRALKPLILSFGMLSQLHEDGQIPPRILEQFSRHCQTVSRKAKRLAEVAGLSAELVEGTQLAGAIHDVGQLVLATALPEAFQEAEQLAIQEQIPMYAAETRVLKVNHAQAGAYLLGLWGLPESLVETVAYHHDPLASSEREFGSLAAVHLADVSAVGDGVSGLASGFEETNEAYLQALGLGEDSPLRRSMDRVLGASTVSV